MVLKDAAWGQLAMDVARRVDALARRHVPEGLSEQEGRIRYAALLACPLHFLSTSPYAVLFGLFGAWTLSALVLPLCLAYVLAWQLLKRGRHESGVFLILGAVAVSITIFSILLGRESRLEVALFYCTVAPFLFFPSGNLPKILLANLIPAACWVFLESFGYQLWAPYPLTDFQLGLFRFFIMPTSALLLLVPLFFLLQGLAGAQARLRDALEDTQRSSAAKSEFLAMVSHELRTPLNGLLGILDMLEREGLKPKAIEELEIARTSGKLLHRLIGDILDYSQLERGTLKLQPLPLALTDTLRGCLRPFEVQAKAKGLTLRFHGDANLPVVLVDRDRLVQILGNLVGNAIKFTDRGEIDVHLAWRPVDSSQVRLVLDVDDTGVGIPEARKSSLFTPFTQMHRNFKANAEGCGLGLSITKLLVEGMGGEILHERRTPEGSRFRVVLPAPVSVLPVITHEPESSSVRSSAPFCGRVLVVDDVKVNRIVATRMLTSLGFQCDEADDGRQALAAWTERNHELIFMDLQMPVMDGIEAAKAILQRSSFEERQAPVIVALTANTFDEHRDQCRKAGMDAFLCKPLSRGELNHTLTELLDTRLPHFLGKGA